MSRGCTKSKSWLVRRGAFVAAMVSLCAITIVMAGCSWLEGPKVKSPYSQQLVSESQLVLERDAWEAAEEKRASELIATREAELKSLQAKGEGELAVVDLDNAKERQLVVNRFADEVAKLDAAWKVDDAKRAEDQRAMSLAFASGFERLRVQREQRGVLASTLGQGLALVPGVSQATGQDASGLTALLGTLLGVGGVGGTVYGVRRVIKGREENYDTGVKEARDAQQHADSMYDEGLERGRADAQAAAIGNLTTVLTTLLLRQAGVSVQVPPITAEAKAPVLVAESAIAAKGAAPVGAGAQS